MVNHQKNTKTINPTTANKTGPPTLPSEGPTEALISAPPIKTANQMRRRRKIHASAWFKPNTSS